MALLGPILLLLSSVVFFNVSPLISLLPLASSAQNVQLDFTGDKFEGSRFYFVFALFIFRSIFRRLGLFNPGKSTGSKKISLSMSFKITPPDLISFLKASGAKSIPKTGLETYQYITSSPSSLELLLSALTMPGLLLLLAKRGCPVDPLGSVNVRNRFEIPDLPKCIARLEEELAPSSSSSGDGKKRLEICSTLDSDNRRKMKKGWEYDLIMEISDGEAVLYRQIFTFLCWEKHRSQDGVITAEVAPESTEDATSVGNCMIGENEPIRWAALSRDYNPIHTAHWAAKLFGLKGRIAHGSHIAAKAITAVNEGGEKSQGEKRTKDGSHWMEVEFRRPVFVPARLDVQAYGKDQLQVMRNGKAHVVLRSSSL